VLIFIGRGPPPNAFGFGWRAMQWPDN